MLSQSNLLVFALLFSLPASTEPVAKTVPTASPHVIESYGKLPLSFEANQGQTDSRVKFLSRGSGYTLFLTQDSAVLSLHGKKTKASLKMKIVGANQRAKIAGTDGLPGKSNYFVGNDPKQWRTNVPTYASVKYTGVYPGIDLVYHGNQRLLEYDFVVAPGADPNAIELRFQGAKKLSINRDGALVIAMGDNEVIEHAPVVYQEVGGQRRTLPGRYVLHSKNRVGFGVAEYDKNQRLVIDPELVYSSYLGDVYDHGPAVAVNTFGEAYVAGTSWAAVNNSMVFVRKMNATGSALVYSTFVGSKGFDCWATGSAIGLDASGSAYITGSIHGASACFPATQGAFRTSVGGSKDAFVLKLSADGSTLLYSTYLGGISEDSARAIAVNAVGEAFVVGDTYSEDFPTTPGAFQTTIAGTRNAFVSKLNAAGSALIYSTYLGGSGQDWGSGAALDASENIYITGYADSSNFPTTSGAFQTLNYPKGNIFVSKLSSSGSTLRYSTYLGQGGISGVAIAVDSSGSAYVTGQIGSPNFFPTTPGAFRTTSSGGGGAFVTKLNTAGSNLVYSTYLDSCDSSGCSTGAGIAVDSSGIAYVVGETWNPNFPTTPGASQMTLGGGFDAFVSKLDATGSTLLYSTYIGGKSWDRGSGIGLDAAGDVYVTGDTYSSDFPTTPGSAQSAPPATALRHYAFISKLSPGTFTYTGPVTTATFVGPRGRNDWYLGGITATLRAIDTYAGVSATYYGVDGGPYQVYGAPLPISGEGTHPLLYYSVDTAGNQETPHGQMIKIDSMPPVSHVAVLPGAASSPNFSVQWSGSDATSGLLNYTIYISDNGSPFAPWLSQTTATQAWFAGYLGHTYRFYSAAQDVAGNVEVKTIADATTTVPAQMAADVNGDGQINCADIAVVKASFGKRTGQTGFDPRADINHDGVVDVRDLAAVSQKLIPWTTCP